VSSKTVDVAVVGCGHMGSHHARAVAYNPRCRLVAAVDVVESRAREVAERYGGEVLSTVPEGIVAILVATPTSTHVEVARRHLQDGAWCLVEKPVAPSALEAAALSFPRLVAAHVERFNPCVVWPHFQPRAVRQFASDRVAPPGPRGLDTDVVHDLMLHDLDLFLMWAEAPATIRSACGEPHGRLDEAWVELEAAGMRGQFHASRRAEVRRRVLEIEDARGRNTLDLLNGRVSGPSVVAVRSADRRDAIARQLDAFVDAVLGIAPPAVDFGAALAVLELADRISVAAVAPDIASPVGQ
jgi:predicted dehydrogenase